MFKWLIKIRAWVMNIFTKIPQPTKMMLSEASSSLCIPVSRKLKISKYAKFDLNILSGSRVISIFTNSPWLACLILGKTLSIKRGCYACQWSDNVDMHTYADELMNERTDLHSGYSAYMQDVQFYSTSTKCWAIIMPIHMSYALCVLSYFMSF